MNETLYVYIYNTTYMYNETLNKHCMYNIYK